MSHRFSLLKVLADKSHNSTVNGLAFLSQTLQIFILPILGNISLAEIDSTSEIHTGMSQSDDEKPLRHSTLGQRHFLLPTWQRHGFVSPQMHVECDLPS